MRVQRNVQCLVAGGMVMPWSKTNENLLLKKIVLRRTRACDDVPRQTVAEAEAEAEKNEDDFWGWSKFGRLKVHLDAYVDYTTTHYIYSIYF